MSPSQAVGSYMTTIACPVQRVDQRARMLTNANRPPAHPPSTHPTPLLSYLAMEREGLVVVGADVVALVVVG